MPAASPWLWLGQPRHGRGASGGVLPYRAGDQPGTGSGSRSRRGL